MAAASSLLTSFDSKAGASFSPCRSTAAGSIGAFTKLSMCSLCGGSSDPILCTVYLLNSSTMVTTKGPSNLSFHLFFRRPPRSLYMSTVAPTESVLVNLPSSALDCSMDLLYTSNLLVTTCFIACLESTNSNAELLLFSNSASQSKVAGRSADSTVL